MKPLRYWALIFLTLFSFNQNAYAMFGMDAAAMIPFLIKILAEAVKQYQELSQISDATNQYKNLLERYHQGIDEALRLLESLPVRDENILGAIKGFRDAVSELKMSMAWSQTAQRHRCSAYKTTQSESMRVIEQLKAYADRQERNADAARSYAKDASPKGAARVSVETNAEILHTLNQLLRINGQMLKIQEAKVSPTPTKVERTLCFITTG